MLIVFENEKKGISALTFNPFNDHNCHDTKPEIINEFVNGSFINSEEQLYPDKMKNLHNCPIRVSISNDTEPYVFARLDGNGKYQLGGVDIKLIQTLSKLLKFKINITFIGPEGYFSSNGSGVGTLKTLLEQKADLSLSDWWLNVNRLKFFDSSTAYKGESIIFLVPPGQELSTVEKLLFPFSVLLWTLIGLCFLIGFLLIFVIKFQSNSVQSFVFGTNVSSPCLNMIVGFIGGSQRILPKRNFARFLLMLFLLFSLVIRTLYQGSFFKLLHENVRYKEVESISELVEKKYQVYVLHSVVDMVVGFNSLQNR